MIDSHRHALLSNGHWEVPGPTPTWGHKLWPCDLQFWNSVLVSSNIKSLGKSVTITSKYERGSFSFRTTDRGRNEYTSWVRSLVPVHWRIRLWSAHQNEKNLMKTEPSGNRNGGGLSRWFDVRCSVKGQGFKAGRRKEGRILTGCCPNQLLAANPFIKNRSVSDIASNLFRKFS